MIFFLIQLCQSLTLPCWRAAGGRLQQGERRSWVPTWLRVGRGWESRGWTAQGEKGTGIWVEKKKFLEGQKVREDAQRRRPEEKIPLVRKFSLARMTKDMFALPHPTNWNSLPWIAVMQKWASILEWLHLRMERPVWTKPSYIRDVGIGILAFTESKSPRDTEGQLYLILPAQPAPAKDMKWLTVATLSHLLFLPG